MKWKYRLQNKLALIVLVIVLVCFLVSTAISIHRLSVVVSERLDAAGTFVVQTLATFSIESLLAWDYPALQSSINHTAGYDVYILAINIYHGSSLVASYQRDTEEEGVEYIAPIVVKTLGEEKELGTVKIVLSSKKYYAFYIQQVYSLLLLGLILGFGDTFLIYLTVSKMVLGPLKRIEEETEIIGKGNLEYQVSVKSKDEIGRLAQAINAMTKNLRMSIKETEDYKKHLEERVNEMEKFHKLTVGRELKMIELKEKMKKRSGYSDKTVILKKNAKKDSLKEPQNCWDFWKCGEETKKDCPAFRTDSGKDCWLVATDYCPLLKKEFKTCDECPWFKKMQLTYPAKEEYVK